MKVLDVIGQTYIEAEKIRQRWWRSVIRADLGQEL
jgi:hypothetical protein